MSACGIRAVNRRQTEQNREVWLASEERWQTLDLSRLVDRPLVGSRRSQVAGCPV